MVSMLAYSAQPGTAGQALWNLPWAVKIPLFGLPLFWFGAFLIYLLRCAIFGSERSERIDKLWESPWLPRIIMEFGYWMFRIPVRICIALGITPNMITFGSMVLSVVAAVAIGMGHFAFGGWTLLFAFTCDAWDGIVARATNNCSVGGEFFDSTIDRYNDLITYLGYLYYYRNDKLALPLVMLAMIGSTVVSYTRAKGDAFGIDASVGYMQRHERAVWLGISTVLSPIVAAFVEPGAAHPVNHLLVAVMALMAVMTNITALWRISVVMNALRAGTPRRKS
jgi:CDP-diacylglycerol--glycerol-3-phosphate 3-phosphatidyltransferase